MDDLSHNPDVPLGALTRRRFLGLVGSSAAAASLTACRAAPPEEIVPYVERPPEVTPGKPVAYATCFLRAGYAVGLLGQTREGRPIKIEGNPRHPASLGGSGAWEQASVLSLYDQDRPSQILRQGRPSGWRAFQNSLSPDSNRPFATSRGEGLHLWLEPTTSPVVERLVGRLRERYPRMQVWFDPSAAPVNRWEGAKLAFGRALETLYDFGDIERLVALDADFLQGQPMSLRWAKHFARKRHLDDADGSMNRLYTFEPAPSVTGISSDHRFPTRASQIESTALGLLGALAAHRSLPDPFAASAESWLERAPHSDQLRAIAKDLWDHRGRAAVLVGERQPPPVHALAHALNELLGSVDETVHHVRSPVLGAETDSFQLDPLFAALEAEDVDVLMTLGTNPAYTGPAAWRFAERAKMARTHVHVGPEQDETARASEWFVPTRHLYEEWGLARAQDGTLTPIQPLIRPLFGQWQVEHVLAALDGQPRTRSRDLVSESLQADGSDLGDVLRAGLLEGSGFTAEVTELQWSVVARATSAPTEDAGTEWELILQPDSRILDGRYANNAWLQELPEPVTKLVWDNAALMSPRTAEDLGVDQGDMVQVSQGGASVRLPVWPQQGVTERTLVAWLGYGRRDAGEVGRAVGVDVGPLRPAGAWFVRGARVQATDDHYDLVTTQPHGDMEGRPIVLRRSLAEFREHPDFAEPYDSTPPSIYSDRIPDDVVQWGMAIDLNKCTGCSACVVACQAENNVPAVGKPLASMGRAMHWLRIDRYYTGEEGREHVDVQPMLCQHCEQAPCEYVCPVYATAHSPDGLNEMIYNRCVGTRFCSNNCPYKVRRFNWYDFYKDVPETRKMAMNPDVTVRGRGVMEKCTYCVQRIRRAGIEARREGRQPEDVHVETACQQACPTDAIVFGQVSDPDSDVSRLFENPRTYAVLNEVGTRPRTRYLARILNRNEELDST